MSRNFAVSCEVHQGRDPVCQCQQGYTGKLCDRYVMSYKIIIEELWFLKDYFTIKNITSITVENL